MEHEFSLKEHLRELEERLLKPEIRTSAEEISKLLADDFFEYGSSGHVWHKHEGISEGGIGLVRMTLSHFEIHRLSDEAVLTTYRIFNEKSLQHSLRSSIWKYGQNGWQMFFHQGTPTRA